jgi:thiamine biosynthesis lipoprotein ApbE
LIFLAFVLLPALHTAPPHTWVEREAYLMGTTLRVAIDARERGAGIRVIEDVFAEVRRLDAILSTWRDDSEIAALNHAPPGRKVELSAELARVLAEVADWSRATEGAFDPAVGPLIDAWGLRGKGRVPTPGERATAVAATGLGGYEHDAGGRAAERRGSLRWAEDREDIGVLVLIEREGRLVQRWNRAMARYLVTDTTSARSG